ncbi:hypothetical protein [Bradyrhizobium sp. SHOUNA76]|uniref:hypothetical protein n=1 Tax=Bradyrhizobium sp. SHOUNA76 TaxID=2908927 RepID=UPI001FF1A6DC|nr:hypothetical protein [Bradyrhizobium sp. SHOUNA76]MCJ9700161.1 hypothetical protein [Bradyrhizobium sp. SHOUNA76]
MNVGTASKQTPRIGGERKIAMPAQLGVCIVQYFHFVPRFTASRQKLSAFTRPNAGVFRLGMPN